MKRIAKEQIKIRRVNKKKYVLIPVEKLPASSANEKKVKRIIDARKDACTPIKANSEYSFFINRESLEIISL